ncbi:hypothetical protein KAX14_04505, partial [Candidatus Bipolaricaulota bacterium]|nr:hypothetical protein [Candidatus Bipolaricaulota bacterium]
NDLLVERGYDPDYGARPMRRAIERMIENRISELILEGTFSDGSAIRVSVDGEEMSFTRGK